MSKKALIRAAWSRGLIASLSSVMIVLASPGLAEEDHLKGYKVKDLNKVPGAAGVTVTNQFGNETCDLKKPQFFLVQSEKNGGNDPRGGPAGDFVCYKAKCTGPLPPVTEADGQFGLHNLETKKAKLVCLPVDKDVCGDGDIDPGETCDGGDDSSCPGSCLPNCTCPPQTCGNNSQEGTEECDGTDATACPSDCLAGCTCAPPCLVGGGDSTACTAYGSVPVCTNCVNSAINFHCVEASGWLCSDTISNEICAHEANLSGCAAECCP